MGNISRGPLSRMDPIRRPYLTMCTNVLRDTTKVLHFWNTELTKVS